MSPRTWLLAEGLGRVQPPQLREWMRGEVGRHSDGTKPRVYTHGDMPWCWECDQAGPCAWLDRLASALGYPGGNETATGRGGGAP